MVGVHRLDGLSLHDRLQLVDGGTAVVHVAHVEGAVLVAAAQAAHVADLLRLEVLLQFGLHPVLRAGHQAGAAVAHVGLLALVALLQEVVEAAGAVGDGLADQEVVGHLGMGSVAGAAVVLRGGLLQAFPEGVVELPAFPATERADVPGHGVTKLSPRTFPCGGPVRGLKQSGRAGSLLHEAGLHHALVIQHAQHVHAGL